MIIILLATLSGGAVGALITRAYYRSVIREAVAEVRAIGDSALLLLKPTQAD